MKHLRIIIFCTVSFKNKYFFCWENEIVLPQRFEGETVPLPSISKQEEKSFEYHPHLHHTSIFTQGSLLLILKYK